VNLDQIQRDMFEAVRTPLTSTERMKPRTLDGRSTREIANRVIKPNDRLTSVERLEIYNRQYWFRLISTFADDFPGLRAITGARAFEKIAVAYLADCPSRSFSLRNLGSRLEFWLRDNLEYIRGVEPIALDMVRLEWADIEAFDGPYGEKLTEADLASLGEDPRFHLQPYVQLLDLSYPVDELLLHVRRRQDVVPFSSNAVNARRRTKLRRSALPAPEKTFLAVYRLDDSVYFKRLDPEAFALLGALRSGLPLSRAIEISVPYTNRPLDRVTSQMRDWFANWASLGWFTKSTSGTDH